MFGCGKNISYIVYYFVERSESLDHKAFAAAPVLREIEKLICISNNY